jgi:hypothetical protein
LFAKILGKRSWLRSGESAVLNFGKMAAVALIVLLSGCVTTYEYVVPASDAGRLCVTQCAAVQETCRGNAQAQASRDYERCESREKDKLVRCLLLADTKEKKASCQKKRDYCIEFADDESCESRYRACYQMCGGQVIERE